MHFLRQLERSLRVKDFRQLGMRSRKADSQEATCLFISKGIPVPSLRSLFIPERQGGAQCGDLSLSGLHGGPFHLGSFSPADGKEITGLHRDLLIQAPNASGAE